MKRNYKRITFIYLLAAAVDRGITFLLIPVITRLLTTAEYGIISTYDSWFIIIGLFMHLNIAAGVKTATVDYKENIKQFVSSCMIFTAINSAIVGGIVLVITNTIMRSRYDQALVVFCLIQAAGSAIIAVYSMFLMMDYRYILRTLLQVMPKLLSISIAIVLVYYWKWPNRYLGRIIPYALTYSIFGLAILLIYLTKTRVLKYEYVRYGLIISVPLVLHSLGLDLLSQADRIMITEYCGSSPTGIYSLVYSYSMLTMIVISALDGVWTPFFFNKVSERDLKPINQYAKVYISVMTTVIIILLFIGPEFIVVWAGKSYAEGIIIIPPLILSNYCIFLYTFYVLIQQYHKKSVATACITIIAATLNLTLNILLIPTLGYTVAAYTTLISYFVALLIHGIYSRRIEKELLHPVLFFREMMVLLLSVVFFYILIDYFIIRLTLAVIVVAYTVLKNKEYIKPMVLNLIPHKE